MSDSEQTVKPVAKVGDTVRLKRSVKPGIIPEDHEDHRTATVKAGLSDTEGGLYMERDLRGCRYWNVEDVDVIVSNDTCQAMIGKRVMKKSKKPFLSGEKVNTVNGLVLNAITKIQSYTFVEDESDVECFRCKEYTNDER